MDEIAVTAIADRMAIILSLVWISIISLEEAARLGEAQHE
jgi:hypothetical protein